MWALQGTFQDSKENGGGEELCQTDSNSFPLRPLRISRTMICTLSLQLRWKSEPSSSAKQFGSVDSVDSVALHLHVIVPVAISSPRLDNS